MHDRIAFWGLMIFCVVAFVVAVVVGTDPPWDWGDVPTWVGAVTMLLAFGAVAWVVKIELAREDARLVAREAARDASERAEQADLVAAWHEWNDAPPAAAGVRARGWVAAVRNASPLPVYDCAVVFVMPDGRRISSTSHHLLKPDTTTLVDWPEELRDLTKGERPEYDADELARELRVGVRFRDTAGRSWERNERGILSRPA